jgi:glycosyltransferase involved in cell wall biosynthesis
MRVVLLSTSDLAGGAARAAFRLMQGLRALDHDCSMLVRQKLSTDKDVHPVVFDEGAAASRREREAGRIRQYCIERNRTAISNTWFSLPAPGYDLSHHEKIQSADILHLHWVSQLLSPPGIARLQDLGKPPIVWTLHDQRPFTGGCHFSAGCQRYETDCKACPQLRRTDFGLTEASLDESRECIGRNVVVACPSRWMSDCAQRSSLFKGTRIVVIPGGVDTNVFKPRRAQARKELGLDPTSVYLLAGADYGEEQRKGFHLLREAVRLNLAQPGFRDAVAAKRIRFLVFGHASPWAGIDLPTLALGRLDSEPALAKVYAASDAFLLPSLEDNLPNTMLESVCSGTPVIGFAIGGLPDVIESGKNGLLVPAGDAGALARAIQDVATNPELRHNLASGCEAQAGSRFGLREQAKRYEQLYKELRPSGQASHHGSADIPVRQAAPQEAEDRKVRAPTQPASVQPLAPFGRSYATVYPRLLKYAKAERSKKRWSKLSRLLRFGQA